VSAPEWLLLALAGLGAGLAGSIAGLASLISYPTLLAVGLPPVAANVTNTVALVFSGVGSALGSRPELRGQGPRLRRLAGAGALGGLLGSALLLSTPPGSFELIVPWLIGLASIAILAQPPPLALRRLHHGGDSAAMSLGIFVVAIYGGYFGAAAGVLMLAILLIGTGDTLARVAAVKNAVLGLVNGVAALVFVVLGPVQWSAVVPLALGFLTGGRLGPELIRRAPAGALRVLIAVAGVGLAVHLGLDSYRPG
jgi:uncharacterized membrane protein YfcA